MREDRKKVLLVEYIHPEARRLLEQYVQICGLEELERIDALIDRNDVVVDRDFLDRAVNLKVIGVHGTGMDAVDVEEAKRRGIEVFSTPGRNARSVAELNVALALDLCRNISAANRTLRGGTAVSHQSMGFAGQELGGKICGLLGIGTIARQTAAILKNGFGAEVIGWSRSYRREQEHETGIRYCASPEEVLLRADILFLGMALNSETEGFLDEKRLRLCRRSALLINTARGRLIREDALYQALTGGWIAGAASDVFVQEPVTADNPLVGLDNFLAVPHLGANTDEALYRVGMAVVRGVLERLHLIE